MPHHNIQRPLDKPLAPPLPIPVPRFACPHLICEALEVTGSAGAPIALLNHHM